MDENQLSQSLSDLSSSLSSLPPDPVFDELEAKDRIEVYANDQNANDMTKPILQSFIDYLPSDGKRVLCRYIASHPEELRALACHLYAAILSPMKACGGKTPLLSPSPFGEADDAAMEMNESCRRHPVKNLKESCLERDGYRCVVTKRYAMEAVGKFSDVSDDVIRAERVPSDISHIIPFALGRWKEGSELKNKSIIWTTLPAMFPDLKDIIKAEDINAPYNLMMMEMPLNHEFGALNIALEPMERENTYRIITYPDFPGGYEMHLPAPNSYGNRVVRFQQHRGSQMPLPSRVLLATHAAIARILHASGMGELIDRALEDMEDSKCLASDGSTNVQFILPLRLAV